MEIQTFDLETPLDALRIGSVSRLLWISPSISLAGFGAQHEFSFDSINGFAEAQQQLLEMFGPEAYGFASLNFDRSSEGKIILPKFVYIDDGTPRIVALNQNGEPQILGDALSLADELISQASRSLEANVAETEVVSGESEFWPGLVSKAVNKIQTSSLNKVVIARKVVAKSSADFSFVKICDRLRSSYPTSMLFVNGDFIGASPETLIAKSGLEVSANPLAGTQKRSGDEAADSLTKQELLSSTKDQWEHRITIDWFLDTLLPFCSYVDADPEPVIVDLANVFHLGTRVQGMLSSKDISIAELVAALHPTPAVGGEPQSQALEEISVLEGFDRGKYAGPVGWLSSSGDGEFAVGIRSAQISGNTAELFAGVGVVADSDPVSEFAETQAKLAAMLNGIGL